MALIRVLRTAAAELSHVFTVDETPTSASVGVVVTVKRLDGTTVTTGPGVLGAVGTYTFTVPGQSTLDTLAVEWEATSIGGAVVTATDFVEIVGGYLFGLKEARDQPPPLNETTYPTAMLAQKRLEVEEECERITGRSFVPRFRRIVLSGQGGSKLLLPEADVRALRSVSVGGTALTVGELGAVYALPSGVLDRGYAAWPYGWNNIAVEYEVGMDYPPEEVRMAAMKRLRSRLTMTSSGVPDRAISWNSAEGGTYRISLPSGEKTGVPDVDATYERWTLAEAGFA